jgi:polysaccharide biosynthesis protein PslH
LPEAKVTTIPTGVDLSFFQPAAAPPATASLVFTGDMSWLPNEDALLYFCAEILPIVQRQIPDLVVWVVGRKPTKKVQSLAENPAVRVTGFVDDIRPYVHQAAAYIVPLRIGGGTRIKIFEAMAMGMPVISTTVGAEGLPVQHGENVLLADDPAAFAEQTVRLLSDAALRRRLGAAARELVQGRYSWSAVTNILDDVLKKVAAR